MTDSTLTLNGISGSTEADAQMVEELLFELFPYDSVNNRYVEPSDETMKLRYSVPHQAFTSEDGKVTMRYTNEDEAFVVEGLGGLSGGGAVPAESVNVPDYANMESINRITTSNGTWTADRDGFVSVIMGGMATQNIAYIVLGETINGLSLGTYVFSNSAGNNIIYRQLYAVKAGDVIRFNAAVLNMNANTLFYSCYFIPPRQVPAPWSAEIAFLPDYANIETTNKVTAATPRWTADRDGFVLVGNTSTSQNNWAKITVNGKPIALWLVVANHGLTNMVVPIKRGDVVELSAESPLVSAFSVSPFTTNSVWAGVYYIPPVAAVPKVINPRYSTDEVDTGKTWIDGKPIYRRVFTGGVTVSAHTHLSLTLAVGIDNIIDSGGEIDVTGTGDFYSVPSTNADAIYNFVRRYASGSGAGSLQLMTKTIYDRTNVPYRIWVEYTKL